MKKYFPRNVDFFILYVTCFILSRKFLKPVDLYGIWSLVSGLSGLLNDNSTDWSDSWNKQNVLVFLITGVWDCNLSSIQSTLQTVSSRFELKNWWNNSLRQNSKSEDSNNLLQTLDVIIRAWLSWTWGLYGSTWVNPGIVSCLAWIILSQIGSDGISDTESLAMFTQGWTVFMIIIFEIQILNTKYYFEFNHLEKI